MLSAEYHACIPGNVPFLKLRSEELELSTTSPPIDVSSARKITDCGLASRAESVLIQGFFQWLDTRLLRCC